LGVGESSAQGFFDGSLESLSDGAEAIVSSLRKAERQSGLRCETLFFNREDPTLESHYSTGSKTLTGEGQIGSLDIHQVMQMALRMTGCFEKSAVYSCPIRFLVDGKDLMTNPLGVFGRQLDVTMHVLLASAETGERWERLIQRCGLEQSHAVPSVRSTLYGVLSPEEYQKKILLWDLGRDYLHGAWTHEGSIQQAIVLKANTLSEKEVGQVVLLNSADCVYEEMVLTGDLTENESLVDQIRSQCQQPVLVKAPKGVGELHELGQASLAGLLRVASEFHNNRSSSQLGESLFLDLRQKAVALIKDYF